MPNGPGKYDDVCTLARIATSAEAIVLIVANGNEGQGFSVQMADPRYLLTLPSVLRDVADEIEKQQTSAHH